MEQEIKDRFVPAACAELEEDVLAELQSIMRLHSIDVQELWYKWESYSMKMGADDMKLNLDTARALKNDVQDGLERENRSKTHLQTNKRGGATPRNVGSGGDVFGMWVNIWLKWNTDTKFLNRLDGLVPNTPRVGSANRHNVKRKTETPSVSRVKAEITSSPPEFKTPYKPQEQAGSAYVVVFLEMPHS